MESKTVTKQQHQALFFSSNTITNKDKIQTIFIQEKTDKKAFQKDINIFENETQKMCWKLLYPPPNIQIDNILQKKKIFRVNGICDAQPQHNIVVLHDPRNAKKKVNVVESLILPQFLIDDNYCAIPYKRELSIIGLNDNINENFLRGLCKKNSEPIEIIIYYHPVTKKHLGMAFIDFYSKLESDAFIEKFNGKTMMGSIVSCFFDPMAYKVSKLFEKLTNSSAPIPKRYEIIKGSKTLKNIQNLLKKKYAKQGTLHIDFVKEKSNGTVNDSFFDSTTFEKNINIPKKNLNELQLQSTQTYRSNSNTFLMNNSNEFQKFADDNIQENNVEKKKPINDSSKSVTNGAFDLKNLSSHDCLLKKDLIYKNDASFCDNDFKESNDSVILYIEEQNIQNKENRNSIETNLDTDSSSDNNAFKVKKNLKNANLSAKKDKLKHGLLKKQGTHRWSSSSDSYSSEDEKKNKKLSKKSINSTPAYPLNDNQENQSLTFLQCIPSSSTSVSTTSTPKARYSSFSPSVVTPASSFTSFCSPRQVNFANNSTTKTTSKTGVNCSSMLTSSSNGLAKTKSYFYSGKNTKSTNKFQNFSTSQAFQQPSFKDYLPPPALINPPIPVTKNYPSNSNNTKICSSTKAVNLEQRLLQIFGKTSDNKSDTQNSSSGSSFTLPPQNINTLNLSTGISASSANSYFYMPLYQDNNKISQNSSIYNDNYNYPPPPPPIDNELNKNNQLALEMKEKLQEKMIKCFDVCKKARNTLEVDLKIIIKKDLQRRLESEAFKVLDEEYQKLEMQQNFKKNEMKLTSNTSKSTNTFLEKKSETLHLQNKENSGFFNIFTTLDNFNDDNSENYNNIFGISYSERMRTLPSFKKKKIPEVVKSNVYKSKSTKEKFYDYNRKKERTREQKHKTKSIKEQETKRLSPEFNKFSKEILSVESNSQNFKKTTLSRQMSFESSSEMLSSDTEEEKTKEEQKLISSDSSSMNVSRVTSEGEETSDKEIDIELDQKNLNSYKDKKAKIFDNLDEELEKEKLKLKCNKRKRVLCDDEVKDNQIQFLSNAKTEPNDKTDSFSPKKLKMSPKLSSLIENETTYLSSETLTTKKDSLKIWSCRTEEEELKILNKIQTEPLNKEDCNFLKLASIKLSKFLNQFMPDDRKLMWIQPNIIKIPQKLPKSSKQNSSEIYYDDPELNGIIEHLTGSARTEGFYKINKHQKRIMRRLDDDMFSRNIISTQDEIAVRHKTQAAKDERAMNRRLLTYMGDNALLRVNQLKYRSKMIKFARSRIHGWGLYALETISLEEMIIEYVGEKIRPTIADEREKNYERRGQGSSYMFRIDGDAVIDATQMGNYGRFINHSCSPNCTARVVMVDGEKRIVIYSKRLIEKGEEITYDYKFAREDEASKIECLCGSKSCQKYLN